MHSFNRQHAIRLYVCAAHQTARQLLSMNVLPQQNRQPTTHQLVVDVAQLVSRAREDAALIDFNSDQKRFADSLATSIANYPADYEIEHVPSGDVAQRVATLIAPQLWARFETIYTTLQKILTVEGAIDDGDLQAVAALFDASLRMQQRIVELSRIKRADDPRLVLVAAQFVEALEQASAAAARIFTESEHTLVEEPQLIGGGIMLMIKRTNGRYSATRSSDDGVQIIDDEDDDDDGVPDVQRQTLLQRANVRAAAARRKVLQLAYAACTYAHNITFGAYVFFAAIAYIQTNPAFERAILWLLFGGEHAYQSYGDVPAFVRLIGSNLHGTYKITDPRPPGMIVRVRDPQVVNAEIIDMGAVLVRTLRQLVGFGVVNLSALVRAGPQPATGDISGAEAVIGLVDSVGIVMMTELLTQVALFGLATLPYGVLRMIKASIARQLGPGNIPGAPQPAARGLITGGTSSQITVATGAEMSSKLVLTTTPERRMIHVSGEARRELRPDLAHATLTVATERDKAVDAQNENAVKANRVVDALRAIEGVEIRRNAAALEPVIDYPGGGRPERIVGYRAVNTIEIRTRRLDTIGKIMDSTVQAGVGKLQSVHFTVADKERPRAELLAEATRNARRSADSMAEALHMRVVDVRNIQQTSVSSDERESVGMSMRSMASDEASARPTPVAPGIVEMRANVDLDAVFEPLAAMARPLPALPPPPTTINRTADAAYTTAPTTTTTTEGNPNMATLYERLGGSSGISKFAYVLSENIKNSKRLGATSPNINLSTWTQLDAEARLDGLRDLRGLFVKDLAGGPFKYTGKPLSEAHMHLRINNDDFDALIDEVKRTAAQLELPAREAGEVVAAFEAQRSDVTLGSRLPMPVVQTPDVGMTAAPKTHSATSAVRCSFGSRTTKPGEVCADPQLLPPAIDVHITVLMKPADHPYFGIGSNVAYAVNGNPHGRPMRLSDAHVYRFIVNDPQPGSHPFYIGKTARGTDHATNGLTATATGGATLFVDPKKLPRDMELNAACAKHEYMGFAIRVSGGEL